MLRLNGESNLTLMNTDNFIQNSWKPRCKYSLSGHDKMSPSANHWKKFQRQISEWSIPTSLQNLCLKEVLKVLNLLMAHYRSGRFKRWEMVEIPHSSIWKWFVLDLIRSWSFLITNAIYGQVLMTPCNYGLQCDNAQLCYCYCLCYWLKHKWLVLISHSFESLCYFSL